MMLSIVHPYLTQVKKTIKERQPAWRKFRSVALRELALIGNRLLAQALEGEAPTYNEDINKQQELIQDACTIVFFTFRQNHRLVDPASDFATIPKSMALYGAGSKTATSVGAFY